MASIFKPERHLLLIQLKKYAHYVNGDVLDVGSGKNSRYSDLFKVNKYTTLDNNRDLEPDIVADAQNIPLGDESFDSIISTQTLEHIPNPQKAIGEFYRLLKKRGYAVVSVPFFNESHEEPHDYWRFTKFSLEKIFSDAGFKIITMNQRGGFFSVLSQNIIRYMINGLNLSKRKWGILLAPFLKIFGLFMIFLDKIDSSESNRKFALGWVIVAQK